MVVGVLLAVVGVILIVAGIVLFANGVGVNPDGQSEGERVKQGFARVPYREMLSSMPRSVKAVTDSDAGHRDRLRGAGAFVALVGIVVLCLGIVALLTVLL